MKIQDKNINKRQIKTMKIKHKLKIKITTRNTKYEIRNKE